MLSFRCASMARLAVGQVAIRYVVPDDTRITWSTTVLVVTFSSGSDDAHLTSSPPTPIIVMMRLVELS